MTPFKTISSLSYDKLCTYIRSSLHAHPVYFPHISDITNSSLCITSILDKNVQHVKYYIYMEPALTHPTFISKKGLNQNPPWYTNYHTKKITHVSRSRPFPSQWPITHILKTRLISFTTCFDHYSRFDSLTLYFKMFLLSDPALPRDLGVEWLHSVHTLEQFTP